MRNYSDYGETIGLNLQCVYTNLLSKNCGRAVNIQSGGDMAKWQSGIHVKSNSSSNEGRVGIDFDKSRFGI
jgi:hypothetical protein